MKQLILVDACNCLHRLPGYRKRLSDGMDVLAEQLMGEIRPLHDSGEWELHLVVDGRGNTIDQVFPGPERTLSILYAPASSSADAVIEAWLLRLGTDWRVQVASEDGAVRRAAMASGADVLSTRELLEWAGRVGRRSAGMHMPPDSTQNCLGNRLDGLL